MVFGSSKWRTIDKQKLLPMSAADLKAVTDYHAAVDHTTKFIPLWVKVAVALALGLGTMAANGSGLQWSTVRNMLMAWILTLPASIALAFALFIVLRQVF